MHPEHADPVTTSPAERTLPPLNYPPGGADSWPGRPPQSAGSVILAWVGLCGTVGTLTLGVLAAWAALGTSLAVPGIGIIVDGPIIIGLAGAGLGAILGG